MNRITAFIKQRPINENIFSILIALSFSCTVLVLYKLLRISSVGVDLTDEGYYFNWISNPWLYKYYASQFGYIYHPLYKLLGNSIVNLRQANILISFCLSWLLSYLVLRDYLKNSSITFLFLSSACLSISAFLILMITGRWLPTPSYNSLNFQGCVIAALGFVLATRDIGKTHYLAMFLIGVGGSLSFLAKPSTAMLLAIVAVFYFLPTIRKDWRILVGAGLVSVLFLIVTAICIDDSVSQFIHRYQGGFLLLTTLSEGYGISNLLKLDFFSISVKFKIKFLLFSALLFFIFIQTKIEKRVAQTIMFSLATVLLVMATNNVLSPQNHAEDTSRYHALIILSAMIAAIIFWITSKPKEITFKNYRLLILFLVLPYIFAAGSGNNYWQTALGASIFWVLATILTLLKVNNFSKLVGVMVAFVVIMGSESVFNALKTPYRQSESILNQSSIYIDPHTGSALLLSKDSAKYLNTLSKAVHKAKFQPDTPVIDLTGHHPGSLYFMQAKAIGQAWTSGGYDGSYNQAVLALYQASCEEIAQAWLLIEVDGKRQISESILAEHGLDESIEKYKVIVGLKTQTLRDFGSINQKHPDGRYVHYLLQPSDVENQTKACLAYRKTHPSPFEKFK